jgi:hypothetical protein
MTLDSMNEVMAFNIGLGSFIRLARSPKALKGKAMLIQSRQPGWRDLIAAGPSAAYEEGSEWRVIKLPEVYGI